MSTKGIFFSVIFYIQDFGGSVSNSQWSIFNLDQAIIWGENKSSVSAPKWCFSNSLSSITHVTSSLIKGLLTNLGCQGDHGELQGLRWLQLFDLGPEHICKSLQLSTVCRAKNFFCISFGPVSALSSKNIRVKVQTNTNWWKNGKETSRFKQFMLHKTTRSRKFMIKRNLITSLLFCLYWRRHQTGSTYYRFLHLNAIYVCHHSVAAVVVEDNMLKGMSLY